MKENILGGNRNYTDTQMHKKFCVSIWDSWEIVFTYTGTQIHRLKNLKIQILKKKFKKIKKKYYTIL